MPNDPLMNFLQNGSSLPSDAVPVNYRVQPKPQPQSLFGNVFDMMNPMNWLKSQVKANPELQQALDIIEKNGGDPKTAFLNECKNRNANPEEILNQVKSNPFFKQFIK